MKFLTVFLISIFLISGVRSAPQFDDEDAFADFSDEDAGSPEVQAFPDPPQPAAAAPIEPKLLGASVGGPPAAPKHQHDHQSASAPVEQFQQQQGGNHVGINQTCGSGSGKVCNPTKNLECNTDINPNRCKCKPNLTVLEASYVYSPYGDKCYPVAREDTYWACDVNEQCTSSKLGRYSRCNEAHICECFDTENRQRTTVKHEDVCYVKKEIQDTCETDLECQVTIPGGAVCLGLKSNLGLCQCSSDYIWHPLIGECLKLGTINSTCKVDTQCNDPHALGNLGFCHLDTGKCGCRDVKNGADSETGYLEGKCYYSRGVNETCTSREECVLGYGKNAECQIHPAYRDERVCVCPRDKECSGTTFQVSIGVLFMGVVAHFIKSVF